MVLQMVLEVSLVSHPATKTRGWHRPDTPHITIAVKNPQTQQDGTHEASHGYTEAPRSAHVVEVRPSGFTKPDSFKSVWPQGLQQEEVQGNPAVLGEGFVSRDVSEETGSVRLQR